ncbi:MAG: hypothetical protein JOZ81_35455 [Chloroflexi bacterium]|nr:hypothetical protein [Chloroflexota bacterium]
MAKVLDSTHGVVLYSDQLVELVKLLGFEHAWAERFRRAIAGGRAAGRDVMERATVKLAHGSAGPPSRATSCSHC